MGHVSQESCVDLYICSNHITVALHSRSPILIDGALCSVLCTAVTMHSMGLLHSALSMLYDGVKVHATW